MSLASTLTGMITGGLDMAFAGEPAKVTIKVDDQEASINGQSFEFQYNPESFKIRRAQARTSVPVGGTADKQADQNAAPQRDSGADFTVFFDTYEQRTSVYTAYIQKLEQFVSYDSSKHAPPIVTLHYGEFTNGLGPMSDLVGKMDNLDVDYTMFLKNGTPVRAKVTMAFRIGLTPEEQQRRNGFKSPDHAKLVTVKRGMSLSDVAADEYDDPGEWRRIARANDIDDPMSLTPGMKLIVPPILNVAR